MSNPQNSLYDLQMFLTTDYPCSYLPGRQARNLVADPAATDQDHMVGQRRWNNPLERYFAGAGR